MKIGLVSPYDYSFPGGVVNHICHLAHHFIQWGHRVKVVAPCLNNSVRYFEEEVIPVGRPFPVPTGGSVARIPLAPWLPEKAEKILQEEDFDILHLHEPFTPVLAVSMLAKSKSRNVGTFHAYHTKPRGYWMTRRILKRWLPKLHVKIAVSKPALEFVSKHLPGDYQIIPNGIDTECFSPDGPRLEKLADGKLNILFVGRLEKRKGLDYLIRACGIIKTRFSDFRLIVVGPGTRLRPGYERLAEDMGLDNVVFTGLVPASDLPLYYRSADICCSPATGGESFGIVLLEAMASGRPVVATNIEGYASVLNHGEGGLLVTPRDEQALADALLALLKDDSLRRQMGDRGRMVSQRYSWESVARRVMDVYVSLLK